MAKDNPNFANGMLWVLRGGVQWKVFSTLPEVKALTEQYRQAYNRIRPYSPLGYRPPAPEPVQPADIVPKLVKLA